uniref:Uncharacterized protein n=1 Tax=Myotis myotis TaxID=51298 RepID=A0A7J7UCU9_MYOMY|nr:hypothetical protein mMyoMyo1_008753 [Myotis myotis]
MESILVPDEKTPYHKVAALQPLFQSPPSEPSQPSLAGDQPTPVLELNSLLRNPELSNSSDLFHGSSITMPPESRENREEKRHGEYNCIKMVLKFIQNYKLQESPKETLKIMSNGAKTYLSRL